MNRFLNRFFRYNIDLVNAILSLILCVFYIYSNKLLFGLCWALYAILRFVEYLHRRKIYKRRMRTRR